ncbi:inactive rhomboid protein 1 isoform X2 [Phymastichus coffea]|uniref:inactive rhomboid protein 1 isoform X2 n=1 Tax=Phymastichus coffea TaxID=108790 RepID=UPI00273A8685|nr:inactive rhomboid protein 1 isoform X2 [Phymastichus coffea]
MPTDDDCGRRERLLLHQSAQYGQQQQQQSSGASPRHGASVSISSGNEHPAASSATLRFSRFADASEQSSRQSDYRVYERSQKQQQSEYANTSVVLAAAASSSSSASASNNSGSNTSQPSFSAETFPSPPSPAPANDRFVPPPPLSPSAADKYASSQSLATDYAVTADRLLSANATNNAAARELYSNVSSATSKTAAAAAAEQQQRYASTTERLLDASGESKEQQRYAAERLLSSPVLGSVRYAGLSSAERLLSSSPIHAPVPERFASSGSNPAAAGGKSSGYLKDSPLHERYASSQPTSSHHHDSRYGYVSDRYLSASANPEGAHQRYASSERILGASSASSSANNEAISRRYSTDRAIEAACQKYADSRTSPAEFTSRFQGYQDATSTNSNPQRYVTGATSSDRFNDLAMQRYSQSRPSDRFVAANDRYLSASSASHHDARQNAAEIARYSSSSSTERLLSSCSSPSLTETTVRGQHHVGIDNGTGHSESSDQSSTTSSSSSSRYTTLSPTPDSIAANPSGAVHSANCYSQQQSSKQSSTVPSGADKYHHQLSSKTLQSYPERGSYDNLLSSSEQAFSERYAIDRFGGDARFQTTGSDRYHCTTTDRYSNADKYLSLPKPKDRYNTTGRIGSSCASISSGASDRSYVSSAGSYVPPTAHTPVERYVPQPPPEVLYPDRYVERYVPPGPHTPADRYVPPTDPGDSYIRRDLGFHHHYRLPPTAATGYSYTGHQSHFRFRTLAYHSPGRVGGSPGSSSTSSSTSAQRDGFATSPLFRSKVCANPSDFSVNAAAASTPRHQQQQQQSQQQQQQQQPACCSEAANSSQRAAQLSCCQPVRRSIPAGALTCTIPQQAAQTSWQTSLNATATSAPIASASGAADNEPSAPNAAAALYPSLVASQETPAESATTTATTITGASTVTQSTVTAAACTGSSMPNVSRSVSAPAGPRPQLSSGTAVSGSATVDRPHKLRRSQSRTEAIKNYIKRETATFFGVDEETEASEKQKWLDRRRRMASRKYGALLPEYRAPDPDITKDVPDSMDISDSVISRKWQRPVRRKDSVPRMALSALQYVVDRLRRQQPSKHTTILGESRSFPPSAVHADELQTGDEGAITDAGMDEEEETFFKSPVPAALPAPAVGDLADELQAVDLTVEDGATSAAAAVAGTSAVDGAEGLTRIWGASGMASDKESGERVTIDGQGRRQARAIPTRDHYILRSRQEQQQQQQEHVYPIHIADNVGLRTKAAFGGKRISPSTIDRVFDNSNRRQYGMGIVGRFFGRSFRKSVAQQPDVRRQLDDIDDHRPYFTYWITTVQVLILVISLACYGFGPVGFDLHHSSSLVLVTSLSLQQVEYQEPSNFWIGPRAADLIHLGAKFAPCMRRDIKILKEIDVWREKERDTACCIRNDDSGCVQSSKTECSDKLSTWKKWGPADSGPGGRISGSVCGLDPKFCDAPASIAPYEWPDDITKWPICRKMNPFSQRFRSKESSLHGNANFPVGRYKDKMAEHMVCEVIGHPCCIGIHGTCRITTKEYCDFVHGYFHEEASLCSQVECLHDVCGMIPFLNPEWPDQFYRLFTTTFLHAGILHIAITLLVQYFLMRDLEKLTGSIRIGLIYFIGALAGNLASAIFVPYRADVGPAGAHFALLATLVVEVLHCWPMLKYPRRALMKLMTILFGLLLLGILPWVDNYAHLFGFIFGFLAAYALMPFISFGHYDRQRKIFVIWICVILIVGLFGLLLTLFYNVPMYECEVCKLFNCVPFTRDFCASQNINFKREEPV